MTWTAAGEPHEVGVTGETGMRRDLCLLCAAWCNKTERAQLLLVGMHLPELTLCRAVASIMQPRRCLLL